MSDEASHQDERFRRRDEIARAGRRLPTEDELLRGMSFFQDSLAADIREFADRLARRFRKRRRKDLEAVISCLEELTVEQSADGVIALDAAFDSLQGDPLAGIKAIRLRCVMYRASYGDPDATAAIAGEIALLALKALQESSDCGLLWSSLGWLSFSRDLTAYQQAGVLRRSSNGIDRRYELSGYSRQFETAVRQAIFEGEAKNHAKSTVQQPIEKAKEHSAEVLPTDDKVIVLREVGNASVSQGKQVEREFKNIVGRPLSIPSVPDLLSVRAALVAEFPHASPVVDQFLRELVGRSHIQLRPTILLGQPGSGKSRFARRLTEELGAPFEVVPCGGISDGSLGGTPRRWSSGEPSLPLSLVRQHECAGVVIILDEIDKVGSGRNNGNPHDVLLGLFERETSARWHDPYIQASCDLSHLSWLMTANTVASIPAVLRDRCRIVRFPEPSLDHLPFLAINIMERVYAEHGHDPRWVAPLARFELDAVASAWSGGSIRKLQRILEKLVEFREQERSLQ